MTRCLTANQQLPVCETASDAERRSVQADRCRLNVGLTVALLLLPLFIDINAAAESFPTPSPTNTWLDSLDAGYQQSQRTGQPIFVFICADWVGGCREEWNILRSAPVVERLSPWTRVHLDPDGAKAAERTLGVVTLPAFRVLTADGVVVATNDTVLSADGLNDWLVQTGKKLSATPVQDADESVDAAIARLGDANTAVREAAMRRLRGDFTAVAPVVESLATNKLALRLSAVDLLEQWGAPLDGVDPWQSVTLTTERLAMLRAWAQARVLPPTTAASTTRSTLDTALALRDLDALVAAPTEVEARAVRERLVWFNEPLLSLVYRRIENNPPAPARQRLIALRYRLVATDRLSTEWPGGFDRLAAADPGVRRAAVAELSSRAKPEDHRLLVELFSDDDPFVREQSLRLLRSVGGAETGRALTALLADPEPNVRASVLKTLTDAPDESLAGELVRYVANETDTDLIVHAVRVLQVTPGVDSFNCLKNLLAHSQWRVRGEAAEAMLGKLSGNETDGISPEQKQSAYDALIQRLDDEDGYVANRAAFTLIKADFAAASGPLMRAAARKADLACDVLKAVAREPATGKLLLPQIRELTRNPRADVRAAAVAAVAALAPETCGDTLQAAMHDPDAAVRAAGGRAAVDALDRLLPRNGYVTRSRFLGFGQTQEKVDLSNWVEDFRKGVDRPKWLSDAQADLEQMLTDADTRLPAAVLLSALGKEELAMKVLLDAPNTDRVMAAAALPWLPSVGRLSLFRSLMRGADAHDSEQVLQRFVVVPDLREAGPVWELLGPDAKLDLLEPVHSALQKLYMGDRYYDVESIPAEQQHAAVDAAKEKAKNGAELQRTVALALLLSLSPPTAESAAQDVFDDPHSTEWSRLDAFQVLLLAKPVDQAVKTAVTVVGDKTLRKIAIPFLANGAQAITEIRGSFSLNYSRSSDDFIHGQTVTVTVPPGLDAASIRAVKDEAIAGDRQDLAAYAGYLLVLLGEQEGFEPLTKMAAANGLEDPWSRLLYRAIAKANDDTQTPMLAAIFDQYMHNSNYKVPEFYWTTRAMTGEKILKLRKRIEDEYGMERLR